MRKSTNPYTRDRWLDRVSEYLVSGSETPDGILTDHEQMMLQRVMFCHEQILRNLNRAQIVAILRKRFTNDEGRPISEHTAYKLIRDTETVLGSTSTIDKNYLRSIAIDMCKDVYRRAIEKGDLRAQNSAITNLIKVAGLDRDELQQLPTDILDRITIAIQVNPALLDAEVVSLQEVQKLLADIGTSQPRTLDITHRQ